MLHSLGGCSKLQPLSPHLSIGTLQAPYKWFSLAQVGLEHALAQLPSQRSQPSNIDGSIHCQPDILVLAAGHPVMLHVEGGEQRDAHVVSMAGTFQGQDWHPHVQTLAGGGCPRIGPGIKADVHEAVGAQMVCRGCGQESSRQQEGRTRAAAGRCQQQHSDAF